MIGLIVLAIVDPATNPIFPPCMWRVATGLLCPGCGSARAIHAVMHGHVNVALQANPLAVAAMPLAAADIVQWLRGVEGLSTQHVPPVCLRALALGTVAFGVLRNLFP
jgi:hypothetical protein